MSMTFNEKTFEMYKHYIALKTHFSTDYDYFVYGGRINAKLEYLRKRNDASFFVKASKIKNGKEIIFANILDNPRFWVGEISEMEAVEVYKKWRKRIEALSYNFKSELSHLNLENPNDDLIVKKGFPRLLELHTSGDISIETLVILDDLLGFLRYWEKKIDDTLIWPDINRKCRKYRPFLSYDKEKMRKILLDKMNSL